MLKFTNPLYKNYKHGEPKGQADPYTIKDGNMYYTYATNKDGVALYTSTNFDDWEYNGLCLIEAGHKEYWAPSVIKIDQKFYMYYSSMPNESSDVHEQCIKVAVADKAEGPFEYVRTLLPAFSIDAHVVNNGFGELFIFYCNNDYEAQRAGTYILLDKMIDPFTLEGKPVPVILPTLDEEIFEYDRFRKGQHWHTVEGAFYFEDKGWHYLMYSGSAYTKESYFIGYCVAQGREQDLRRLKFQKYPNDFTYEPLMKKDDRIEGVGHNSVIKIDNDYYIVYHGRDIGADSGCEDIRTFRADLLRTDNGRLTVIKNKLS